MTHIVLIDDYELVRYGLKMWLRHEPDLSVVGEAESLAGGMAMVQRLSPHLVVLGVKLPDTSITEACRRLLSVDPTLRILILIGCVESTTVMAAVQSGAHGYILMDVRVEDLIYAIRTVANGQGYLDPRVAPQALDWIRKSSPCHLSLPRGARLTPRERLILPLLAEGKTNKEIGVQLRISDKTVKNYLANLFEKLHVKRRAEAVAWFMKEAQFSLKMAEVPRRLRSQGEIGTIQVL